MSVTVVDQYGPPLLRALLRDGCEPESIEAFRVIMHNEGASFEIAQLARESGLRLPEPRPAPANSSRPRRIRPKKAC